MVGLEETRSEDILLLFGVHPSTSNFDSIVKELEQFFRIRQQNDSTDRYNFIAFEENGPVYFDDFVFEPNYIISAIRDMKPTLAPCNTSGGIITAVTFIIDVFKLVGGKVFRLIIISDRSAQNLKNIEVVQQLVSQVVDFPFFIDIVRIGIDDPKEDLRQMKFAKVNNGNVFSARNERDLKGVFAELVKKKKVLKSRDQGERYSIPPENEFFFQNLAQDMWVMEGAELAGKRCQICGMASGDLAKCPKCSTPVHGECMAQWAKMSNIGIPHVFRCMSCYNLLRLPKDFVLSVQSGQYKKPAIAVKAADQNALLRARAFAAGKPQLKKDIDPFAGMGSMPDLPDDDENEDLGLWSNSASDSGEKNPQWVDVSSNYSPQNDSDLQIQFCSNCGSLNPPEVIFCNQCGNKLR